MSFRVISAIFTGYVDVKDRMQFGQLEKFWHDTYRERFEV